MSLPAEAKKEYRKLSEQSGQINRRMKALESIIREYKVWIYPSNKTLSDMIEKFVVQEGGSADFDGIASYLARENIELPKAKISLTLTKHPKMHYNRQMQKWELKA